MSSGIEVTDEAVRSSPPISRILVIDDNDLNRAMMTDVIEQLGHEAITAFDGPTGIASARENRPDLIFLDVIMPGMSGFDVCRRLKADNATAFIPVIIMTTLDKTEDRILGIEAGADEFLSRPVCRDELSARIRTQLRAKHLHDELENAHNSLKRLSEVTEGVLRDFDPLNFQGEESIKSLVGQLFKRASAEANAPHQVLISLPFRDGKLICRMYDATLDGPGNSLVTAGFAHPPWLDEITPGKAIFANAGTNGAIFTQYAAWFGPAIRRIAGTITNFAAVGIGQSWFIALNYAQPVTSFDAEVLRSFAVDVGFLEAISAQIRATEDAFLYTIGALARAAEANDEDTGDHIERVNEYSRIIAEDLGLPAKDIAVLAYSAQMHDVGKIHIHPDILRKPSALTPMEMELVKSHTRAGARILGSEPRLKMAREIALFHHERWTGGGYPQGLSGDDIPLSARIVHLTDVYDALRMPRSYKLPLSHSEAMEIMTHGDGRTSPDEFDPRVLASFISRQEEFAHVFTRHYTMQANADAPAKI